ncbi:ParB N-terminal domain-containing protein, partial [Bacillus altitudinis]|uniref:ParB N-terminal domain-containing protein n=1 Tax=Bacillus altitudinis TaxID=293387 RepID=UPI003B51F8C3
MRIAKALANRINPLFNNLHSNQQTLQQINFNHFPPNPYHPTKTFHHHPFSHLNQSIHHHPVLHPIILPKSIKPYHILAGER